MSGNKAAIIELLMGENEYVVKNMVEGNVPSVTSQMDSLLAKGLVEIGRAHV